jgi:hypothetical protein
MEQFTYIGMTPAGCEWRVWRKAGEDDSQHASRVATTTERFKALWGRRRAKEQAVVDIERLYRAARSDLYKARAKAHKMKIHPWDYPVYMAARHRTAERLKALKAARAALG